MKPHIKYLRKLEACEAAVVYASQFETLQAAWDNCEREDWMYWLLVKTAVPHDTGPGGGSCPGCSLQERLNSLKTDRGRCNLMRKLFPKMSLPRQPKGKK